MGRHRASQLQCHSMMRPLISPRWLALTCEPVLGNGEAAEKWLWISVRPQKVLGRSHDHRHDFLVARALEQTHPAVHFGCCTRTPERPTVKLVDQPLRILRAVEDSRRDLQ